MSIEDTKQTTVRFPPELHTRLKVVCAKNDEKINDAIIEQVRKYIEIEEIRQQQLLIVE